MYLSSARSPGNAALRRPLGPSSAVACWRSSALRASRTTSAPAWARARAVARPSPLLAPVTRATCSVRAKVLLVMRFLLLCRFFYCDGWRDERASTSIYLGERLVQQGESCTSSPSRAENRKRWL